MPHNDFIPSGWLCTALACALFGCDAPSPAPKGPTQAWMRHGAMLPATTTLTVFAPSASSLQAWQPTGQALGLARHLAGACEQWRAVAPINPCDPQSLRAARALPEAGVHVGWDPGFLTFGIFSAEPSRTLDHLEAQGWSVREADELWTLTKGDTQALVRAKQGYMLWHVAPASEADAPRARMAKAAQAARTWTDLPRHRALARAAPAKATLHGSIQLKQAAAQLPAPNPRAAGLRAVLAQSQDTVGWSARMEGPKRVRLVVDTSEQVQAPTPVATLDATQGALPPLGHLIPPGTLGVVRASLDPAQVEVLIQSLLAPDDRRTLEGFEQQMLKEFALPLRKNILQNLQGHAVALLYGIDPEGWSGESWIDVGLSLLTLQGTKEALFVPLKDAKLLRDVLDAMTTLTRGKLVRQGVEHGVHYAWMVQGSLQWAMVVYDHAVIVLDSPAAFKRANAQAQKAQRLDPLWKSVELGSLLEGTNASGVYLDVASLRTLVPAPHAQAIGPWLDGLDSVTLVSRSAGRTARTEVLLTLTPKQP